MPAPHIRLIYKDTADGYEFSVASYYVHDRKAARRDADEFVKKAVAAGDFRPDGEIVFECFEADRIAEQRIHEQPHFHAR